MESDTKIIKEIKRRNKKSKENQIFNFDYVISQSVVKKEGVYFNYWSGTLGIRKQCVFQECPCKTFSRLHPYNYKEMQIKRAGKLRNGQK